jgi:hypothetical protein
MMAVFNATVTRKKVMPRMPKSESLSNVVWTSVLATLVLSWSAMLATAQGEPSTPSRISWQTGQEREQSLNAVLNVRWSSNPLRGALANLSRSQKVAIFLDRRVDPDQEVTFSAQAVTARQFLDDLAERLGQGISHIGPVVYVGPKETAAVLATVTELRDEEMKSLPPAVRSRLRRAVRMEWPELTTPRELVEQLATNLGIQVVGVEQLPHDLWPEVDLPPLTFVQRMSLVLAGFHLTFRYSPDGSAIRLEPMPKSPRLTRSYRLPSGQGSLSGLVRRFPNARIEMQSGKVTVIGTVEEHEAIERTLEGRSERPASTQRPVVGETVYNGTIKATVAAITSKLAKDLDLQVEFDPRTTEKLDHVVSYEAKGASLKVLLDAVFSQAGLSYELTGNTLRVLPGETP